MEKVFFDLKGDKYVSTLELMAEKYGVTFLMQIKHMFSLMDDFGVPMTSLANH
jgi:hypothetical protein